MPFFRPNIDRAIVMTQFDLRGFWHPLGIRSDGVNPKNLAAITWNLAAGATRDSNESYIPDDGTVVRSMDAPFEDFLDMCQRLAEACDMSQKEAIQLIIQDILATHAKLTAEVNAGTRKASQYLEELDRTTQWGRNILALMEAFQVESSEVRTPVWNAHSRV